jgi:VIT1/CCC1 family predicted Fe2+/Mn2+ transporter
MVYGGILFTIVGFVMIPILSSLFSPNDITGLIVSFLVMLFGLTTIIAGFRGND